MPSLGPGICPACWEHLLSFSSTCLDGSDFSPVNYKIISVTMEKCVDQKVSEDLASQ